MKEPEITIGDDYKKFVFTFHESMIQNDIMLMYEGEVNQEVTNVFSEMAETGVNVDEHETTRKRVYHVMVESLQNICKHASDEAYQHDQGRGKGILIVGSSTDQYTITTGNKILNKNIGNVKEILDRLNPMSPEEIKGEYKQMIRAAKLSDKGGAGLGFIDMIKRTGNPIEYLINPISDDISFLVLASRVDRVLA